MKQNIHTPKRYAGATNIRPSSHLEQNLLGDLKALCEELHKEGSTSRVRSFQTWKLYWIASNGEIGRKKEVANDSFEGVLGNPHRQ